MNIFILYIHPYTFISKHNKDFINDVTKTHESKKDIFNQD